MAGRPRQWRPDVPLSTNVAALCRPFADRSGRSKICQSPGLLNFGAGEGNRTLVVSLEGFCSTIELHPLGPGRIAIW